MRSDISKTNVPAALRPPLFTPVTPGIFCEFKDSLITLSTFHAHDGYEIFCFAEGEANFYIDCNCHHLAGGELVLINPGEYHRIVLAEGSVYKRVSVHASIYVPRELSSGKTDLELCLKNAAGGAPKILQLSKQELQKYTFTAKQLELAIKDKDGYGGDLLLNAAVTQYFVQLNSLFMESRYEASPFTTPELMRKIVDYVDSHLAEGVRLEDMGRALNFNAIYMNRYFKSTTGLTIGQYVLSKKVNLAKKYLAENRAVSEVCELAGFGDCANFSRTFAKRVGCSPREFQKTSAKIHNRGLVV